MGINFKTANNNTYEKSHKVPHGEELTDKIQDESNYKCESGFRQISGQGINRMASSHMFRKTCCTVDYVVLVSQICTQSISEYEYNN